MTIVNVGRPPASPRALRAGETICICDGKDGPKCGGVKGYRPLFTHDENGRATTTYRQNDAGEPLSRLAWLCKSDVAAMSADVNWRAAHAAWKRDRNEQLAAERAGVAPPPEQSTNSNKD